MRISYGSLDTESQQRKEEVSLLIFNRPSWMIVATDFNKFFQYKVNIDLLTWPLNTLATNRMLSSSLIFRRSLSAASPWRESMRFRMYKDIREIQKASTNRRLCGLYRGFFPALIQSLVSGIDYECQSSKVQ